MILGFFLNKKKLDKVMNFVVKEGSSVDIYSVFWEELNFCKCFDIESMKILSVFIFLF